MMYGCPYCFLARKSEKKESSGAITIVIIEYACGTKLIISSEGNNRVTKWERHCFQGAPVNRPKPPVFNTKEYERIHKAKEYKRKSYWKKKEEQAKDEDEVAWPPMSKCPKCRAQSLLSPPKPGLKMRYFCESCKIFFGLLVKP
jgi:hypothetical protein